jgi:arsenate reductase
LLVAIVGSGIAVDQLGLDPAAALFAHAVCVGLALGALIAALAPVSGAHFNPAVTLALWRRRVIDTGLAWKYALVQIAGAAVGTMIANLMFSEPAVALSATDRSGAGQLTGEVFATTGLALIIVGLVALGRTSAVPGAVGAWVAAMIVATSSTGFANPAVTVARTLTDTYTGIAPSSMPGFIAAQLVGSLLALLLAAVLFPMKRGAL